MPRTPLPIDPSLPEIVAAVRGHAAAVVVAPPGAGKTTRVPVALLEAGVIDPRSANPVVVMLQPRRVAARASAARIAAENGWELGREVGYHVRFDRKIGRDTRLRVLTEGILTRQLLDNPFLEGVGCVILDEFHERSLNTDLAVALLREVQQTVRDDLKVVVMSATLDAEPVAAFFGGAPIVRTAGRTFPIDVRYEAVQRGYEVEGAVSAVQRILSGGSTFGDEGHTPVSAPPLAQDVLVFLPGADEIRRVLRGLDDLAARKNVVLLPLHGSLTPEEQDRALRPDPHGRRKVIAATNIAETSLTIEGVGVVVDTGLARVAGYDAERGLDRLDVLRISRASATQRAGRAGRTGPGACVRLWSEKEATPAFETPEVRRVDLAATVLELAAWGKHDPRAFGWYEAPDEPALAAAQDLLRMLGAIDAAGKVTPVGQALAGLPVHPRLGRLMLAAVDAGLPREGATLAALISEKDILRPQWADRASLAAGAHRLAGDSDLLARLAMLESGPRDDHLDRNAVHQVLRVREELIRLAERLARNAKRPTHHSPDDVDTALLKLALWAYPDRVCRRRGGADRGVMVGGGGVRLSPESVVRQGEFFVAADARQDDRSATREALVRIASRVEIAWLEEMFPGQVRREKLAEFDDARQRVVGVTRLWYRDLLLHEDKNAAVDPAMAGEHLAAIVRQRGAEILHADESAANVIARVRLLREKMPDQPWPAWDDSELAALLADSLGGAKSLDAVRRLPLAQILKSALPYPLDRMLEKEAPEAIEVPSGSHIRLRYERTEVVLAVRLQELFGLLDTPRIVGGRVPVKLELLAPNYRPVQVTMDLRSFWANTYFQVRKDLKARYPKHAWPDDPLTATPEAKGRRRQ
ncbi:MAG: ATP-dependent helicase HrpB [Phycisphaerae bacterium]|nr:ATP-dependent helicase HrpB [Tepidisphaeraceae bacterium]